jgi:hypothetical protein
MDTNSISYHMHLNRSALARERTNYVRQCNWDSNVRLIEY